MEYNISRIRRVYETITRYPSQFDQADWTACVAGWTIRLFGGDWGLLKTGNPLTHGFQCLNFRTGAVEFTEIVAGRLLGMDEAQMAGLVSATNPMARNWLEDILVEHDMRELDLYAAGYSDDYPISEVQG